MIKHNCQYKLMDSGHQDKDCFFTKGKVASHRFYQCDLCSLWPRNSRCYNKNNRWRLPLCLGTTMVSKELCLLTTSKTPTRLLIKTEMIKWITRTVISHDLNIGTRVHQGELQPPIQISAGTVGLVSIGWFKCFSTVGLLRKGVYMYFIYFRWSSIMNMAQFANKVIGQPVTNWDVS